MIANLNNIRSHELVDQAVEILINLTHRGAAGSDGKTGDGAGVLMQMPHEFMVAAAREEGFELPGEGSYAVGVLFLRDDQGVIEETARIIEKIVAKRDVPQRSLPPCGRDRH